MSEMFENVYMQLLGEELMIYSIKEREKKSCSSAVAKLIKTEQSQHVKLQLL